MGSVNIVSRDDEQFLDRVQAGVMLGRELKKFRGKDIVVLGIPRGGVVVASSLAGEIDARIDIVLSRKIGAPGNAELAIGAISEDGKVFLNEAVKLRAVADASYLENEKKHQLGELARRVAMYRKVRPKIPLKGKTVIITDDGLATGATMQAALWSTRQEKAGKLVCAVPVAPEDTASFIAQDCDELIILRMPYFFAAVGQFYKNFEQTSDEEVVAILKSAADR